MQADQAAASHQRAEAPHQKGKNEVQRSRKALAEVRKDAYLDHAFLAVLAAVGGVHVADVLEGGVRSAAGKLAQLVAIVHHALQLVRSAKRRRLACNIAHACITARAQ